MMSLRIVKGGTGLPMSTTQELHDRFLAKRTKALALARACLYLMRFSCDLEDWENRNISRRWFDGQVDVL